MRALRYHGVKDLRLEHDVPEPTCGETQIKIRRMSTFHTAGNHLSKPFYPDADISRNTAAFCGICGTDCE